MAIRVICDHTLVQAASISLHLIQAKLELRGLATPYFLAADLVQRRAGAVLEHQLAHLIVLIFKKGKVLVSIRAEGVVLLHFLQALLPVTHPILLVVVLDDPLEVLSRVGVDYHVPILFLGLNTIALVDEVNFLVHFQVNVQWLRLISLQLIGVERLQRVLGWLLLFR